MLHKQVKLTTREAAAWAGISRVTLQRWIAIGKVEPPKPTLVGGRGVRYWSGQDLAALREVKLRIYRKGRGRKPKGESTKVSRR